MGVRIQSRRDTAAAWTSNNPILNAGEIGFETDTGYFKIGDGSAAWNSLDYATKDFLVEGDSSDAACFPVFVNESTGLLRAKTNTDFTFDSTDGSLGISRIDMPNQITTKINYYAASYYVGVKGSSLVHTVPGSARHAFECGDNTEVSYIDADRIKSYQTEDATATDTGAIQTDGGIYAAKNIFTEQRSNASPWKFITSGQGTIGATSQSLDFQNLPAYDAYRLYLRIDKISDAVTGTRIVRVHFNGDIDSSHYTSYFISFFGTTNMGSRNVTGVALCQLNDTSLGAITLPVDVTGRVNNAGEIFGVSFPTIPQYDRNSGDVSYDTYVHGRYVGGASTQINRMTFQQYASVTSSTPATSFDAFTITCEIYGATFNDVTFT